MFDVVPPNAEEFDREEGLGRSRRRGIIRGRGRGAGWKDRKYGAGDLGNKTVEVEWKLPARLRKPVRQQLQKERAERSRRKAVIRFDRRPIHTQAVARSQRPQDAKAGSGGAEMHMGDTYRHSKPNVHVSVPPYRGKAIAQRSSVPSSRALNTDAMKSNIVKPSLAKRPAQRTPKRMKVAVRGGSAPAWEVGERDVPYQWQQKASNSQQADKSLEIVTTPSKGLSLPFSFSWWPRLWGGDTGKKKLKTRISKTSLGIFIAGLGLMWGVVWNLQGAGRGFAVLGLVQGRAQQAIEQLGTAKSALAEADLTTGEASLAEAERLLGAAKTDVEEALQASHVVLRYVDVTGTVRSGESLLVAGQELTGAGKHIVRGLQSLEGAKPVADDLLGVQENPPETTLVDGLVVAQQEFEQALAQITSADEALGNITSSRIPEEVRPAVEQMMVLVPRLKGVLTALTEQSDSVLYLLGAQQDRQYLLAFANHHELRPVGGFIGTVGLVNMDRGIVEKIDIGSVYDHDGQLQEYIAAPGPLQKIVDRWYLRDTNWFVNYPVSARKMAEFLEKERGPTVDGVILMTPEVIERLLELSGPVVVPGYDVIVSADNFVEVTQSQVTYEYDPSLNKPKQFLADLTPLLLSKVLAVEEGSIGQGRQAELLIALTEALSEKELLMYFQDEEAQSVLARLGWDGSLPTDKQGFLAVNTANVGGHKSDQFVEQEIDYRSQILDDGEVEVTLTIRREHKGPTEALNIEYPEGENPAQKDNVVYQRVLVPKGAELLEASGFTNEADVPQRVAVTNDLPLRFDPELAAWQSQQTKGLGDTVIGEEAGYAYFAHWMITPPGHTTVGLYRYRLPATDLPGWFDRAATYQAYVYKQPGDENTTLRASIELPEGYEIIHTVPEDGVTREDRGVVYRGGLRRDVVVGVVMGSV